MIPYLKKHIYQNAEKWLITILTGFFLFFVLYFYKGFNIQQGESFSGHGFLFRTVSFGLVTSLSFFIHEFFLSKLFKPGNRRKRMIWLVWEVFFAANVTFLLFDYFWNWKESYWSSYFLLLFEYALVMTFPISVSLLLVWKIQKAKGQNEKLSFYAENGKHVLSIRPENFLCIKSEDNYAAVFYILGDQLKKALVRNTLKNILKHHHQNPSLIRCHRSYVINTKNVCQMVSRGRLVELDMGHSVVVPVSKKYQSRFLDERSLAHSSHI